VSKDCVNCRHRHLPINSEPCTSCDSDECTKWEPEVPVSTTAPCRCSELRRLLERVLDEGWTQFDLAQDIRKELEK
jgi:hypothetical protein